MCRRVHGFTARCCASWHTLGIPGGGLSASFKDRLVEFAIEALTQLRASIAAPARAPQVATQSCNYRIRVTRNRNSQGPVLTESHLENEDSNSIRVPFLALVLLSNHVVYKDLPALMQNLYYP
jgi:hypothetical protein